MQTNTFPVLVGFDFSASANLALDRAIGGVRRNECSELHVTSVIDDDGHHLLPAPERHTTLVQLVDRMRDLLTAEVNAAVRRASSASGDELRVPATIHVRLGGAAEQIAALATEIRAGLVIVGTNGRRGLRRMFMGSVAEHTVRLAPCPVLVVRPTDFRAMEGMPAIEPPCVECVKEREASGGAHWWCKAHSIAPEPAHTYSFSSRLTDPPRPRNDML